MEAFEKTQFYGVDRLIGGGRAAANMGNATPPVKSLPWNRDKPTKRKQVFRKQKLSDKVTRLMVV